MKRQAFCEKLSAEYRMMGFKNLIDMDETGFDAHCNCNAGGVAKGQKILGLVSGKRRRRTHLMMAQRHHASGRKKDVIPLPPYSPDFNPIEQTFERKFLYYTGQNLGNPGTLKASTDLY
ncbi:hypothetical protein [Nitrosococcus oceani]|uniref:hypothetical protein n=1 Tax=Nitrosococcus oceani TaxID=1229 RepID=UPI0006741E33|nr:hypothetical protein [Nitrosococcus oceani]GEM21259.1 hypothetical protein NONS58_26930 [Nitrosococcus oceani]